MKTLSEFDATRSKMFNGHRSCDWFKTISTQPGEGAGSLLPLRFASQQRRAGSRTS